jgi:hypothetical protein
LVVVAIVSWESSFAVRPFVEEWCLRIAGRTNRSRKMIRMSGRNRWKFAGPAQA